MSQLSEALKSFDTSYLAKAKNELIHAIPGDATFTSHVGMILRALLSHELGQRAQAEQSAAAPRKLATGPTDEPPPHEWTDPAPPNEPPVMQQVTGKEVYGEGSDEPVDVVPVWSSAKPPTPSTRTVPPPPFQPKSRPGIDFPNPQRPPRQDW